MQVEKKERKIDQVYLEYTERQKTSHWNAYNNNKYTVLIQYILY